MLKRTIIVGLGLWLGAGLSSLRAQTFDVVPYEYGFEEEESAEAARWVLNPGTDMSRDSIDRWVVGTSMHHSGQQAMYISVDGEHCTAGSPTNEQIVQFAYRDFVLPDGQYYISFDWICPNMMLHAGYVNYVNLTSSQQAQNITEQLGTADLPNIGRPSVSGLTNETWTNSYFTINVKQPTNGQVRTTRVWFAWVNGNPEEEQEGISAAIDNVQLTTADCGIPMEFEGFVYDCDNIVFTWQGSSARYQFQYRHTGDDDATWRNRMVNNGMTEYTLQGVPEGNYDIRLRGICYGTDTLTGQPDTTYSPYVYLSNFNIYCPELHCINYANLTDTAWTRCTYGTSGSDYYSSVDAPYQFEGVVDFGWDNENSRHTVIWDTQATDPRTNNQLKMVPTGSLNSVRLGNWLYSNGTEAITYKYVVDENNGILLINYAIVLEEPSGHGEDGVPRFIIRVKDENGETIDADCGVVDLNSETKGGSGWNTVTDPSSYYGENIVYKDWTTLGLNLDPYKGQTIYISVETFDCFWGGHYGYAYFTMDCQSARIKNTSCGNQASMTVHAPSGFYYAWYADGEFTPRYTTQSVDILSTDPTNWRCQLTSTENENCHFDLEVNTAARYPQAEFTYEYAAENCENRYYFTNTSYIWTNEDGVRHDHRDEVPDEYEWTFSKSGGEDDTEEPNPGYVTFPEEGGTFAITLAAKIGLGEGVCRSDTTIIIDVPALGDTHTVIDTTICEGSFVEFHGQRYFEDGLYTYRGKTPEGCYANDSLTLTIVPQTYTVLDTATLCYGDTAWLAEEYRVRDGVIKHVFENYMGCDSVVVMPVHVMPHMLPSVDVQEIDEEHESGSITITIYPEDSITHYTVNGTDYTGSTVLKDLVGGTFYITFYNRLGCTEEEVVRLCAYEIFQRWNEVVSLKNKNERGGGEFIAYQWYNHDEPIEGATKSYYYKDGGFDGTEVLYCLVTLPDGTQEQSCTFIPTVYEVEETVSLSPTAVESNAPISVTVPSEAVVTIYSLMGVPVQTMRVEKGKSEMRAPAEKGVYPVRIQLTDRVVTTMIVVD